MIKILLIIASGAPNAHSFGIPALQGLIRFGREIRLLILLFRSEYYYLVDLEIDGLGDSITVG